MSRISAQLTDCSANGQSQCVAEEFCSQLESPALCYTSFNVTDYLAFTVGRGTEVAWTDYPGITQPGYNLTTLSTLLDNDESTGETILTAQSGTFGYLTAYFPDDGYWTHHVAVLVNQGFFAFRNIFINGQSFAANRDDSISGKYLFTYTPWAPLYAKNITFGWNAGFDDEIIYEFTVYGAYDSPDPTTSPTLEPTAQTSQPSVAPSETPTFSPSAAPTAYPVPGDICREFVVQQSCCGLSDFIIQDDAINLRDPTLTTCEYSFDAQCCGTLGGFDAYATTSASTPDDYFFGCDLQDDRNICDVSFFDTSINTTDDIYGTVISAVNSPVGNYTDFWSFFADTSLDAGLMKPYCTCNWTVRECDGEDTAICGSNETWNVVLDECFPNDTDWSIGDDLSNETCFKEKFANSAFYAPITYTPCSLESFAGSVSNVQVMTDEVILDGSCGCEYYVQQCDVYVHPVDAVCPNVDQNGDPICGDEGCSVEVANPCCSTGFDLKYDNYTGVTPEFDGVGRPRDGTWTCYNTGEDELCPDLWEGSRMYEAEPNIQWWYDEEVFYSRCGCLYLVDQCEFPPTQEPTTDPTTDPTGSPSTTEAPDSEESKASFCKISVIVMIISMICTIFAV